MFYFCCMKNAFLILVSMLYALTTQAQVDLLVEDFENGIPSSWKIINNDGNTLDPTVASDYPSPWVTVQNPDDESDYVASCASYFTPEGTASRWLITPQISLGTYGNYIHWKAKSQDPSYPDSYMVLISTTGNAVSDFSDTLYVGKETPPVWLNLTVSISDSGYNNVPVYLAFVDNSYYGYKLYIDSVHIEKESTADVKEFAENVKFNVYPNPTKGVLNINTSNNLQSVMLTNLSGKTIIESQEKQLNLAFLPKGIYILRVYTDLGVGTRKIVKY